MWRKILWIIMRIEPGKETKLRGIPLSGGVVLAKVCLFNEARHRNLPVYNVAGQGVDREIGRIRRALRLASDQLGTLEKDVQTKIGKAESEIFMAQKMVIEDEKLHFEIFDEVEKKGVNAEVAIERVLDIHEKQFLDIDNEYIRSRATDIGEIKRRLLDVLGNMSPSLLCSGTQHCQRGKNRVIVAEELTPALTVELDTEQVLGFVTEKGGITSHAAILARAFGIAAVSGIKGIRNAIVCGTELLINGHTGEVIVWPSRETVATIPDLRKHFEQPSEPVAPVAGYKVMANISRYTEVDEAEHAEAEGVGLYRTEFDFLAEGRILSEDEMFAHYTAVLEKMAGKSVMFRMLDLGADKSAPFLGIMSEENPYLGLRGSRLLLSRPDLLAPQARALARASKAGCVSVMYPMIVDVEQFLAVKAKFEEAVADIETGEIRHGMMLEVPSACLLADELMRVADFCSIGTNDLVQYLFAVDRNNDLVSYDYNPDRPVFWMLLKNVVAASERTGKPLSVCGELAGDPALVEKLIATGIKAVSVNARVIPEIRNAARVLLNSADNAAQD